MNNVRKTNFWHSKTVLVTGIGGFVGGNLAKALVSNGANVIGIVRTGANNTFLGYEGLSENIKVFAGDLYDRALLERILTELPVEAVFHLAAQVEVGVAQRNPLVTYETNIRGTYNLLDAVRLCRPEIQSIIVASSDKAYGSYPRAEMPYQESYPLKPLFPYDVSKACADLIARSYSSDLYKLPIVVTRFSNIFGPGQLNFSALVPDLIRACLGYGTFVPRGDGTQVRDFLYIQDVVDLYLNISQSLAQNPLLRGGIYNAGTNLPRSVRSVIEEICRIANTPELLPSILDEMVARETIGEIDCQYMNFESVKRDFGWVPRTPFSEGLKHTITWYKKYLNDVYK